MRWMKFNCTSGVEITINMARVVAIYVDARSPFTHIEGADFDYTVTETPEEIIARGQWEVR